MALHDALNLRKDEVVPVSILVFQSVFLGFFLGAFDVGANTLFLNNFGQDMIPKAIVISGITGIILTSLYSFLQSRLLFSRLALLNLFTVFVITALLRVGYLFSDTKWLAFSLFVLMGPLNIVALVGFWGTVGRIFDLRQGKRIFGFIDTGQVVGVIVSSFSIPFLVSIGFESKNLLYISAVSMFMAFLFQFILNAKYPVFLKVRSAKEAAKSSFASTFRVPYVRTMALFVILSMLVAFFVHYLFLAVADERFENPDELAKYFGGLMGALTFVSVLIKTFVYGPLMKTYGLKASLLISPIIMTLITVSSAAVGSLFGYTLESASFTFFFLLISLSKFFQKALKDSIESPVLKLIYQSLPAETRHEVQARVDGTINETAALSSGIVLTILGLFSFISLIHYVYFLIGIIAIWFFVSINLFRGYRRTLKETLDNASVAGAKVDYTQEWLQRLERLGVKNQLTFIQAAKPWLLPSALKMLAAKVEAADLAGVCNIAVATAETTLVPTLQSRLSSLQHADAEKVDSTVKYLQQLAVDSKNEDLISMLLASKETEDRVRAANLMGLSKEPRLRQKLTSLLRDLVPEVKRAAIRASKGTRSKELISFLVDFLEKEEYAPLAHASLMGSDEVGLEMLMMAYNRSGATDLFRKRIVRVIPSTGSVLASSSLFSLLTVQSPFKTEILEGLLQMDFIADERDSLTLHQMLVEQAAVCAWNLNALYHCPSSDRAPMLKQELEFEFSNSRHILFSLLMLQYDRSSIDAVIENLDAGTGQSISFAIELLDTFVVEDLKPYIFPLLEDSSLANKIWALQNYFPLKVYSTTEELLNALLNRSENLIGKQTKIFALNALGSLGMNDASADLIAQLFNSDRVLRQMSAQLIQSIDKQKYMDCKKRLSDKLRVDLDRRLEQLDSHGVTTMERFSFLKDKFSKSYHMAPLYWLYNSSTIRLAAGTDILKHVVFKGHEHILLVEYGELEHTTSTGGSQLLVEGDVVVTSGLSSENQTLVVNKSAVVHYMDYHQLLKEAYNSDFIIAYLL